MIYNLLCDLCNTTSTVNHDNWLGYVGFGIVVIMLIQDNYRKAKAKKNAEK